MPFDITQLLAYAWGGGGWTEAYKKLSAIQAGNVNDAATPNENTIGVPKINRNMKSKRIKAINYSFLI